MLVLAIFFSMASRLIFSPLMPSLQEEMGFGLSAAGTLFLLVSVTFGLSMLLSGFLSSRLGHGGTVGISLATITLGLLLTALTRGPFLLAAGMMLIGAGAGLYSPSGMTMLSTEIDPKYRNTAFALHEIGPNLAFMLFLRRNAPGHTRGTAPEVKILGTLLRSRGTVLGILLLSASDGGG